MFRAETAGIEKREVLRASREMNPSVRGTHKKSKGIKPRTRPPRQYTEPWYTRCWGPNLIIKHHKETLYKPPSFSQHEKSKQGIKSAWPLGQKCFGKVGGSCRPLRAWHAARVTCRQLYRSESGKLLCWLGQPGTRGTLRGGAILASVGMDWGSDATMPAGYEESSALAYFGGARATNKWHHLTAQLKLLLLHWNTQTSHTPLNTCDDRLTLFTLFWLEFPA